MDSVVEVPQIDENEVDTLRDTRWYMRRFYQALDSTKMHPVRVVHYGDSQLEEDRMTMTLRRALQGRYGGKGVGLLPLHQTIPMRTVSQSSYIN